MASLGPFPFSTIAEENIVFTQKMIGLLCDVVETLTVNYHLKKVFDDSELEADTVIRNF